MQAFDQHLVVLVLVIGISAMASDLLERRKRTLLGWTFWCSRGN